MSFDEEIPLGLARSLGRLQLRVDELEEGGAGGDPDEVQRLRAQLAEARNAETRALMLLGEERKARSRAEDKTTRAFERIAAMEKRPAAPAPQEVGYADVVERNKRQADLLEGRRLEIGNLEAKLRGKDQALSELQRKLDAAEQRVRSLEQAAPAPCPVCTAIARMVFEMPIELAMPQRLPTASVGTVVAEPAAVRKEPLGRYEVAPGALRGVAQAIRDQLAKADRPLAVSEIAERVGLPANKIATNIHHQLSNGTLIRVGDRKTFAGGNGYRYWLKSWPLPEGFQA